MRLSEQWLRQWVNPKLTTAELTEQLTLAGLEVDSVVAAGVQSDKIVIGEVISKEAHPDADRLSVCQVNIGHEQPLSIVCGASNVRASLKVAVATIGARLSEEFVIKKTKLRGVISEGMLCSESELGLAEQSDGIMELADDAPISQPLRDYLKLDDQIIEIDLTANRGDCLSIQGIAREVSVLTNTPQTPLIQEELKEIISESFPIQVQASIDCPRYQTRLISGINSSAKTPLWMQEHLRRCGLRSINPVVDVTNYVMLELGQPLHAFDRNTLTGSINVRKANAKEKITLLDGSEIELEPTTLVIADAEQVLAIAGVMGGISSSVNETTRDILLECAFFNPVTIAGKARQYGLHTDSSHRFERGVDPQLQTTAIQRATGLLLDIVGGNAGPITEIVSEEYLPTQPAILLRKARIARLLGIQLGDDEIESILIQLGMTVEAHEQGWMVTAPSYRFDIKIEEDLIEEVVRIYGYTNIPSRLPTIDTAVVLPKETEIPLMRLRNLLLDRDYHETITYSFVEPGLQALLEPRYQPLPLSNALSPELSVMRTNLWAGLVQALQYNQNRQQARVRFFETGLRFVPNVDELIQEQVVSGLISGSRHPEQWGMTGESIDFFDLKGDVEALLSLTLSSQQYTFQASQHPALHPNQQAEIIYQDEVIGSLGNLHPSIVTQLGLVGPIGLFEISLDFLQQGQIPSSKPFSKFPAVRRDLAILVDKTVTANCIKECIANVAGEWLQESVIFDVYTGEGIAKAKKSIALSLILQDFSRTLVDSEVNQVVENVVNSLQSELKAVLRE